MEFSPFWWDGISMSTSRPPVIPTTVDVAIIGAGFTGLCAALVLARAGKSVAVFEAGRLGEGASSRNGGMVGPSFHKLGMEGLAAKYGLERTYEIIRESVGFVDFLEDFLNSENINADFKRTGRFLGAFKSVHYDAMARRLDVLREACDVRGDMVSRQDLGDETGSKRFVGGVVYHSDGCLHPGKYHVGLIARVEASGAMVLPNSPVTELRNQNGRFQLATPQGVCEAGRVAVCTNGYTGEQFKWLRRRILPIRSAMIATVELPAGVIDRLMPKRRIYGDSRRIIAYYRPSPDGKRILFGGRATGLVERPKQNARLLQKAMTDIYPELATAAISHAWSGLVGYSFDHAPHIGQIGGVDFAMGYCGSGVARASYFGQKLGHKILGETEEGRTSFDDLPFETKPLYSGNPWFMPLVLNWHRISDRFGF